MMPARLYCVETGRTGMTGDSSWFFVHNLYMPELYTNPAALFEVGEVSDPTDGKMAHLDGLNFNRAWCLYDIAAQMPERKTKPVRDLALQHFKYSLPHVASGAYEGDHWLGTYVVLALRSINR